MGPLTPLSTDKPDYVPIRSAIQASIDDEPSNLASFATLAVQCSSTFRATDYLGGCNGAAIRYSPQIDWESSEGASDSLKLLEPIKDEFPDISWSDLIVLAGMTAVEAAGAPAMPFCGGRVDSDDGTKSDGLEMKIFNNNTYDTIMYDIANKGLALAEGVALMATPDPLFPAKLWSDESVTTATARAASLNATTGAYTLSNQFFVQMKEMDDPEVMEWFTDDLADIAEQFVKNNDYFLEQYGKAYNYMMTADLFDGPTKNACQGVSDPTLAGQTGSPTAAPVEPTSDDASDATTDDSGDDAGEDDSASSSVVSSVSGTFFALLATASPWLMMA
jgi:catalase (peroxidase I)